VVTEDGTKKTKDDGVVVAPVEKKRDDVFVSFDGSVQTERKKWFGLF
jgi:hypothetical protein